jgi:D-alanyl-D-alanine carboxypeptidase
MRRPSAPRFPGAKSLLAGLVAAFLTVLPAAAGPYLVVDAGSGEVLAEEGAFDPWYPASLTKLMTTYVALSALESGEMQPNSPVVVSARALREPPSRMGFPVGTVLTLDTALKIIMVKSANDIAYAIAESISGSGEAFVHRMNTEAAALGLRGTRWTNPHGLPDPGNVSTARDLAVLSLAIIHDFPQYSELFRITALQLDGELISTHNRLLEQYPGADGMKTGYICSSGFNVVASATRGGRRLVAVVLGDESELARSERAARLLTEGFSTGNGLFSNYPDLMSLVPSRTPAAQPVDLRPVVCRERSAEEVAADAATDAVEAVSYLVPPFRVMEPVLISLGGAIGPAAAAGASPAFSDVPLPRPRPPMPDTGASLISASVISAYSAADAMGSAAGSAAGTAEMFAPLPRPNPLR